MRIWGIFLAMGVAACGGPTVVDGVPLDQKGWPIRDATTRYQCPSGTTLVDERLPDGTRSVTCASEGNPIPRRFKLVWGPEGALQQQFELSDEGRPIRRDRYFASGRLRSREVYKDGQLEEREAWFAHGARREKRDRQADGNMRIAVWQPDGSVESEGEYRGDTRVGPWKEWRDGALEEATYVDGVRDGRVQRTYVDGSVESGMVRSDKREGRWTRVDATGARMLVAEYENGLLNGRWVRFHPNQSPAAEGRYMGGKKHGVFVSYYPTGLRKTEVRYRCDREDGPSTAWYSSGQVAEIGEWRAGKKVGQWKTFTDSGAVSRVDHYRFEGRPAECDLP